MTENLRTEEGNIIQDVKNLFRLEKLRKETIDTTIKDIRNLFRLEKGNKTIKDRILRDIRKVFRLEKENKGIKDRIIRDIRNLFEYEEEDYYKPVMVNKFWGNYHIEYKVQGDRKTLSVEVYLNKIKPYLKDIINDLIKSDTWKIRLTIKINFISSKNDNDKGRVMHSRSGNIEIMINDEADEVIEKLFKSLKKRYQNNLEKMEGREFFFKCVNLLHYKCHKINPNRGGSYIDSRDWIKNKKVTINPINKKGNKCFLYAVAVALNHEEIGKHSEILK